MGTLRRFVPGCGGIWLILVFVGAMGGFMLIGAHTASSDANRAAALPVLTSAALQASPIGRVAIIEGEISQTMRPRYRTLVAYMVERLERDSDGDTTWVLEETIRPMLLVDTADGRVLIEGFYDFHDPPAVLYEGNDLRYSGVRINERVMALGVVQQGSEGRILDAELVHGGTQATYIASQRTSATVLFWIGAVLIGGCVGFYGVFVVRQVKRS